MQGKIKRECPVCGTIYDADPGRLRHGRQTTCSRVCSYRLRGLDREQRLTITCPVCEAEFTRSPAQVKAKHGASFCSPACQYAGRSLGLTPRVVAKPYALVAAPRSPEAIARQVAARRGGKGYGHSDETIARLREATARRIAEGRVPAVSQLEDVVASALDGLGILYRRQVPIRGEHGRYAACVDFLLGDGRALEVNGTFWHADPRAYPDGPVYPSQRRTAERWTRKVAALTALRITLTVVWETELRDDPAQALRIALAAV